MSASSETTPSPAQVLREGKAAGSWVLDGSKTEIRLKSKSMWGMVPVNGVFGEVSGDGTVSPSGDVTGTVSVAAKSVDTKQKKRDDHLRSADFFDVENYPAISFTVDEFTPADEELTVVGRLTVRDQTRTLSFTVNVSHFDGDEAHLDGVLHVNRADFGMNWNSLGASSMKNTITVHAVFTRR